MNKKSTLQQQAINAAKKQDWELAVKLNKEILDLEEDNIGALNRLGVAYLQLDNKKKALSTFRKTLKVDKSNSIAKKHVDRLKNNQDVKLPTFSQNHFIEEPGKTKTVSLHRLASRDVLDELNVGTECELKPKSRYISIEAPDGTYIGALPEDLSFRLTKLLNKGNTYSCYVRNVDPGTCSVFLREVKRSKKTEFINSFQLNNSSITTINDIDDTFLEDEVPVQIVKTDEDEDDTDYDDVVKDNISEE